MLFFDIIHWVGLPWRSTKCVESLAHLLSHFIAKIQSSFVSCWNEDWCWRKTYQIFVRHQVMALIFWLSESQRINLAHFSLYYQNTNNEEHSFGPHICWFSLVITRRNSENEMQGKWRTGQLLMLRTLNISQMVYLFYKSLLMIEFFVVYPWECYELHFVIEFNIRYETTSHSLYLSFIQWNALRLHNL